MIFQMRATVTLVGDSGVGKSSLLLTYIRGELPVAYTPTVFDKHSIDDIHERTLEPLHITIWDTAGQVGC